MPLRDVRTLIISWVLTADRLAVGFGDLICIENNNYWFSLADLGYEGNVLIRANVTGQRTPAVSWFTSTRTRLPGCGRTAEAQRQHYVLSSETTFMTP